MLLLSTTQPDQPKAKESRVEAPTVVSRPGEYALDNLIEGLPDVGLKTVERTAICLRGVNGDGLCL